jgi:hypothetical protein
MGYLQIAESSLPNFTKAIISIWFRIPAATLDAVSALTDDPGGESSDGYEGACFSPPLYKIIPLITFGSLETGIGDAVGVQVQPSFIGIDCALLDDGRPVFINGKISPTLAVNLQTPIYCSFNKTPQDPDLEQRAECYYMGGAGPGQFLTVTPEVLHHALISFDISPTCSITWSNANRPTDNVISPGPTFSWAFDDVGMVGPSMNPAGGGVAAPSADPIADNYIIPQGLFGIVAAGDTTSFPIEDSTDFVVTVSGSVIASNGNPIGIPTSSQFVLKVYNVVEGELQIFTGISANASSEDIRRLFIDAEGRPVDPAVAQAELGQAPDILLHGSSNWKVGNNTGSLGVNFTKTGTINTYGTALDITP